MLLILSFHDIINDQTLKTTCRGDKYSIIVWPDAIQLFACFCVTFSEKSDKIIRASQGWLKNKKDDVRPTCRRDVTREFRPSLERKILWGQNEKKWKRMLRKPSNCMVSIMWIPSTWICTWIGKHYKLKITIIDRHWLRRSKTSKYVRCLKRKLM